MFYYSVVNLLRIVIHYSKYSKSVRNVVIHYIFSSESLRVAYSLRVVNSLRVVFLVCRVLWVKITSEVKNNLKRLFLAESSLVLKGIFRPLLKILSSPKTLRT